MTEEFPCPVPPKPPIARQHCRYYHYDFGLKGGPRCEVGVDLSAPGGTLACMPPEYQRDAHCEKRVEWSEDERAAWLAWQEHHDRRMRLVMKVIPRDNSRLKYWGGRVPCPACGNGTISYSRACSNHHLHAACSTPQCFGIMQ